MDLTYFAKAASFLKYATKQWVKNYLKQNLSSQPGYSPVGSLTLLHEAFNSNLTPLPAGMFRSQDFPMDTTLRPLIKALSVPAFASGGGTNLGVPSNGKPYKAVCVRLTQPQISQNTTYLGYALQANSFHYATNIYGGWSTGPSPTGVLIQDYRKMEVDQAINGNIIAIPETGANVAISLPAASDAARTWTASPIDGGNVHQFVDVTYLSGNNSYEFLVVTNGVNGAGSNYIFHYNIASQTWSKTTLPVPAGKTYKWGQVSRNGGIQGSGQTVILGCVSDSTGAPVNFVLISYDAGATWKQLTLPVYSSFDIVGIAWQSYYYPNDYYIVQSSLDGWSYYSKDGSGWVLDNAFSADGPLGSKSPLLVKWPLVTGSTPSVGIGQQTCSLVTANNFPPQTTDACMGFGYAASDGNYGAAINSYAIIYPTDSSGNIYCSTANYGDPYHSVPFPNPRFQAGNFALRGY